MVPEEFWSRYFFKLEVLLRGGGIIIDEDENEDETEIQWESPVGNTNIDNEHENLDNENAHVNDNNNMKEDEDKDKILKLKENENLKLKSELKEMKIQLNAAIKEIKQLKVTNKSLQDTINILSNQPMEPKKLFESSTTAYDGRGNGNISHSDDKNFNNVISDIKSSNSSDNNENALLEESQPTSTSNNIINNNDNIINDNNYDIQAEEDSDVYRVDLLSTALAGLTNASIDEKEVEEVEEERGTNERKVGELELGLDGTATEVAALAAGVVQVKSEDVALSVFDDEEDEDEEWS